MKITSKMAREAEKDQCNNCKFRRNPPDVIFIQQCEDWRSDGFVSGQKITWCEDRIHEYDIPYVLGETVDKCRQRIAELEAELAKANAEPRGVIAGTIAEGEWFGDIDEHGNYIIGRGTTPLLCMTPQAYTELFRFFRQPVTNKDFAKDKAKEGE